MSLTAPAAAPRRCRWCLPQWSCPPHPLRIAQLQPHPLPAQGLAAPCRMGREQPGRAFLCQRMGESNLQHATSLCLLVHCRLVLLSASMQKQRPRWCHDAEWCA
jgi:hypothetical protein